MLIGCSLLHQSDPDLGRKGDINEGVNPADGLCLSHKTLLVATLERAIRDLFLGGKRAKDAVIWINDDSFDQTINPPPFSFVWITGVLGLSVSKLRQTLNSLTETPIKTTLHKTKKAKSLKKICSVKNFQIP